MNQDTEMIALWMEVQLDMHSDIMRPPYLNPMSYYELFEQLAPAKASTEYAKEELFLVKF